MRYLVLSDIHGGAAEARKALAYFEKFRCDYVILLGDLLNHGPRNRVPASYDPMEVGAVLNEYNDRIIAIKGNCDSEVDGMVFNFPCNAKYGYLTVKTDSGNRKIFLTHGHLYRTDTKEDLQKLGLNENDIVVSGHTHVAQIVRKDCGIVSINPGSTTIPKGGTAAGFALITEEAAELYTLDGELIDRYMF